MVGKKRSFVPMVSVLGRVRFSHQAVKRRTSTMAVNIETMMPRLMVTAKPDGADADDEQDHLDQRREVGVHDGRIGAPEPGFDGVDDAITLAELLPRALVDQDIGIDRHAEREQNAGHAGQRQRRTHHGQSGDGQREVDQERGGREQPKRP